jgi:hypothetical protein
MSQWGKEGEGDPLPEVGPGWPASLIVPGGFSREPAAPRYDDEGEPLPDAMPAEPTDVPMSRLRIEK